MSFDPYHNWLGIPPEEQPPCYYRLLGVNPHETNSDVISNAADRQMIFVRQFQDGEHQSESQRVLNELAAAKICLLNPATRATYDLRLQGGEVIPPPLIESALPSSESGIREPETRKVGRNSQMKVRVIGHILAPIIGLALGWIILQYLRPGRQESVASSSEQAEKEIKAHSAPEAQHVPKDDPFDLPPDHAVPTPEPSAKPISIPIEKETETPVELSPPSKDEQIETLRTQRKEAIANNDLSKAIRVTEQISVLQEVDKIFAKMELLEQIKDTANPTSLVEQCLSLVDEAVERSDKPLAQRAAELALVAARQADDSALVRRATLGVLKAQRMPDSPVIPMPENHFN